MMMVVLASYHYSNSQSLKAISQSGTEEIYFLAQPLTVTFDSSSFVFNRNNTVLKKWGYGGLRKIIYTDISTRIDDNISSVQSHKVSVYPQPSKEQISISYHVSEQSPVHLHMYVVDGALMYGKAF